MKTLQIKTIFTILVCTALFLSCSNNNDDNSSGEGDEFLTAKINGTNFAASTDPATIIGATITNGILAVQGGDNSGNTISFQTSTNQIMYVTISPVATWSSSGVTTFTFEGYNAQDQTVKNITEGKFKAELQ